MQKEIQLNNKVHWKYQTDDMHGICIIAKDKMTINFKFEAFTKDIYDVIKLDKFIESMLTTPVSVEGSQQVLKSAFPEMVVTVRGRAESHGWIEAKS
tara:strand:- start:4099 stop:4389 length:291 start_codon:yes stop_codon:yes gene_type:complete